VAIKTIDARTFKKMFLAGAKNLESNKERINLLNVFPVPDGDTGSNMTLTIMSAANDVYNLSNPTLESLSKTISSGSLRGARGNSGVILSQLFRGFTREISACEEIDSETFAKALNRAVETAYKAVMKPKEGTILTVAKGAATKAMELYEKEENVDVLFEKVIKHANEVLDMTPEMLPVLKQAGVVDSGGTGFVVVLQGWYDALVGNPIIDFNTKIDDSANAVVNFDIGVTSTEDTEIKYGYCTEFIIMLEKPMTDDEVMEFKEYLLSIGDSLVCVNDDELCKIHVHSNDPGLAIQKALTFGQLTKMKIDNMREEHQERLFTKEEKEAYIRDKTQAMKAPSKVETSSNEPPKDNGFITVSAGSGLSAIFKELGADEVIEGGQTMNPSTEDFLNAIDKINAKNIFIFPNNSNIILAATQAADITEDKNIYVIPTKTVPQGVTALINFDPSQTPDENKELMISQLETVKSGSVTYAVRDTELDGKSIKEGNIMGIGDKTILAVGEEIEATTLELIDTLVDEDSSLISLYYGAEVKEREANALVEKLEEKYSELDIEVHEGGQPVYYYILSVE